MSSTDAVSHPVRFDGHQKPGAKVAPKQRGLPRRRSFALFDIVGLDEGTCGRRLRVHMRSEEHTSELQSLMRISYAVFCLKKKNKKKEAMKNDTKKFEDD